MTTYEQGIADGRQQILDILDTYEITELGYGGGFILKVPTPDNSWQGIEHITGSVAQYVKRGCRCVACKKQGSAYYSKEAKENRKRIKGENK